MRWRGFEEEVWGDLGTVRGRKEWSRGYVE